MADCETSVAPFSDHRRAIVRLSAQYLLRTLDIAKRVHTDDAVRAIIFTAIWSANVSHIRSKSGFDGVDDLPSDEHRRPVTVSRIAQLVGMPAETVRRYVLRLINDGVCQRLGRKGVIVPASVFLREDMLDCLEQHLALTTRFQKSLSQLTNP